MTRPKAEWDPSWDDDWQAAQDQLGGQIEEQRPHPPAEAVQYYRHGFIAAMRHPAHDWSDVESELYQDYMAGAPEPNEPGSTNMSWEEASDWVQRGWQAARAYGS
jgi:hypothetical protein